ncbi:hypothetical protein ABT340_18060 [Streptosporangium sp. NPDC000239]|uniref:hypothetical protein n=1 Tax=Streptosporangium sp. NPDC000239 TaxID=3154248 RepID=UPI0033282864
MTTVEEITAAVCTVPTDAELAGQLGGWVHRDGIPRVKLKIGRGRDVRPVRRAREAIGAEGGAVRRRQRRLHRQGGDPARRRA